MKILSILLLLVSASCLHAQQLTFGVSEPLGPSVNTEAEELLPILSADGKTLFFSRAFDPSNTGGEFAGMDIWTSKRTQNSIKSPWLAATNNLPTWNNKESNAVIGTNRDNISVYLLNAYKPKSGIAFSKFISNEWTEPEVITIPGINRTDFVGFFMNPTFDVLLISMNQRGTIGHEDIYVCLKDSTTGSWGRPLNLGPTINTEGFEISPFLSADGHRLYFASNGHGGQGDADIFYSDRLYNSWEAWSTPKNLGNKINSESFDAYFSIYGDSVAFYSSNKGGSHANIYQVGVSTVNQYGGLEKSYLTAAERTELFGAAPTEIRFDKSTIALNSGQSELLFYIANKILTRGDIKIQLVISDDGSSDLAQQRMTVVSDKLNLLGIGNYRIDAFIAKTEKVKPEDKGLVKIVFFR
jgi:hypothetical protein